MNPPSTNLLIEQLALFGQRWHRRRASYRPAGEPFDPTRCTVVPIEEGDAKHFVLMHHYSGTTRRPGFVLACS